MDSVVASEAIDPGSTPGARTSLRPLGFGWQASPLLRSRKDWAFFTRGEGCPPKRRVAERRRANRADFHPPERTFPVFYVYLLQSSAVPTERYIGMTENLKVRLTTHNRGGSPHTAKFRPRNLIS